MLMTQSELAKRTGLALRTICAIEQGHPCRMDTKRKVLAALAIDFVDHREVFPDKAAPNSTPHFDPDDREEWEDLDDNNNIGDH